MYFLIQCGLGICKIIINTVTENSQEVWNGNDTFVYANIIQYIYGYNIVCIWLWSVRAAYNCCCYEFEHKNRDDNGSQKLCACGAILNLFTLAIWMWDLRHVRFGPLALSLIYVYLSTRLITRYAFTASSCKLFWVILSNSQSFS